MKKLVVFFLAIAVMATCCLATAESNWTYENALSVFETEIELPADAAQYRKVLTVELTAEQTATVQRAVAIVYIPGVLMPDGQNAIQALCYIPATVGEDNILKADCSGLYLLINDKMSEEDYEPINNYPHVLYRQGEDGDDAVQLQVAATYYGELNANYNPFTIKIDYAGNTAKIEEIAIGEAKGELLEDYYSVYRVTKILDETQSPLPHFNDLQDTNWTVWYEKKISGALQLQLKPIEELGCKVLFSIESQDGTSYSLAPIDY